MGLSGLCVQIPQRLLSRHCSQVREAYYSTPTLVEGSLMNSIAGARRMRVKTFMIGQYWSPALCGSPYELHSLPRKPEPLELLIP